MAPIVSNTLGRAKRPLAALLVGLLSLAPVHAAPPAVSPAFQPVFIDGSLAPASSGVAFNVIFDGSAFHLWYRTGNTNTIADIRHATSTDAINFTTDTGAFTFTADPFTATPPAPLLYYDAVSQVNGSYKIFHWTGNGDEGGYPAYNTNSSVSDIGATASNSVLSHQGPINPIPGGTQGQTLGTMGVESGKWIGVCGTGQQVCSVAYTDGSPPTVPATIYPATLDATALFTFFGIPTGYINNHGDARSAGVGLEIAFTVRDGGGARFNQQVYFSESSDGGATWSAPVGLLTAPPTLDVGFGGSPQFAHPELLRVPAGNILYVSTMDSSGNTIIAVSGLPIVLGQGGGNPIPTLDPMGLAALLALLALLAVPALRRRRSPSR